MINPQDFTITEDVINSFDGKWLNFQKELKEIKAEVSNPYRSFYDLMDLLSEIVAEPLVEFLGVKPEFTTAEFFVNLRGEIAESIPWYAAVFGLLSKMLVVINAHYFEQDQENPDLPGNLERNGIIYEYDDQIYSEKARQSDEKRIQVAIDFMFYRLPQILKSIIMQSVNEYSEDKEHSEPDIKEFRQTLDLIWQAYLRMITKTEG